MRNGAFCFAASSAELDVTAEKMMSADAASSRGESTMVTMSEVLGLMS